MNQIKINAWNKENKRMAKVYAMDWSDEQIVSAHIIYMDNKTSAKVYPHPKVGDKIKFLLFTGLKDKNGKEIYEKHLLKYHAYSDKDKWLEKYIFEVDYYPPTFRLFCEYEGVKNPVEDVELDFSASSTNNKTGNNEMFEIVGTVFENPELLDY